MNRFLVTVSLLFFVFISSNTSKIEPDESSDKDKAYEKAANLLTKSSKDAKKAEEYLEQLAKLGHIRSKELLAKTYLFGNYLPLDLFKAYHYLESIPTNQSSEAHLYLGFLYSTDLNDIISTNTSLKANHGQAMMHYQLAAELNNPLAKMAIAFRHQYGLGADQSCHKALSLYQSVAIDVVEESKNSGGSPLVEYRLWESKSIKTFMDNVIHYYMFLAKGGDITATVTLGHLFYYGSFNTKKDPKRAFNYFNRASKSGNGNALAFLAKYHLEGIPPVIKNNTKGVELLMTAAGKGNPIAMTDLGLMYLEGKEVEQDIQKAYEYLASASRQGWVEGIVQLGISYMTGSTGFKDNRKAFNSFQLAERSKHLLAMYNLGQMHATGIGTIRSCPRAVHYFKSVAERGVWSQILLEGIENYEKGWKRQAFVKLALMSEMGYELAQSNLAFILDKHVTNKDKMNLPLKYWIRSAAQGNAYSRIKVGDYFYYGLGTAVDYQMAAAYYRKASEFRYSAQALFNLGYLHEKGLGVKQDTNLARLYYDFAATIDINAKVPAFLANSKLTFIEIVQELCDRLSIFNRFLFKNWDLILLTILALILCFVIYLKFR